MRGVQRLRSFASGLADIVCGLLIVAITGLVFFQVIARYVLALAAPWAEELLRLLFVWLIMLAACNSQHLRLDLFEHGKVQGGRVIGAIGNAICLIVLLVLGYGISEMIEITAYDRYSSLDLSVQWVFYGAGIGICLWFVRVIWDLAASATEKSDES
jgi:TRAP-type C4-dicarboxylate transport system permease small subunit